MDYGFIRLIFVHVAVSHGEDGLRKRQIVVFLLFPVIAFVFIAGWILYVLGKPRATKQMPQKVKPDAKKEADAAEESDVEMGLLAEVEEAPRTES